MSFQYSSTGTFTSPFPYMPGSPQPGVPFPRHPQKPGSMPAHPEMPPRPEHFPHPGSYRPPTGESSFNQYNINQEVEVNIRTSNAWVVGIIVGTLTFVQKFSGWAYTVEVRSPAGIVRDQFPAEAIRPRYPH